MIENKLCLHTLRADCNIIPASAPSKQALCLHTLRADCNYMGINAAEISQLCLHTLRADCNIFTCVFLRPPCHFASTRSVQIATTVSVDCFICVKLCLHTLRADCNAFVRRTRTPYIYLCLHTLRADCNLLLPAPLCSQRLCLHTLRADCNSRNAQNCNIHFFRTCVESVDSFSVLNKSMLR